MPVELIAEISGEHCGRLDYALLLVSKAAEAGADAVKLQYWTPGTMAVAGSVVPAGPWAGQDAAELYRQCETPLEWIPAIAAVAEECGLAWLCSVYDIEALQQLERLGCPRYKIASFEATDLSLISAVKVTRKPLIVSVGMATTGQIWDIVELCFSDLTLLHCISAYPAPVEHMHMATLADLRHYDVNVGLSDHSTSNIPGIMAIAMGAQVVEKHITLGHGPDASFALLPDQFRSWVKDMRLAEQCLGTVQYGVRSVEQLSGLRRPPGGRRGGNFT